MKLIKEYGGFLSALVVAAAMIIASLMGYENAWWIILTVYAVLAAIVTIAQRLINRSKSN